MWKLPDGTILKRPADIVIGDVVHPAAILESWSKEELAAIAQIAAMQAAGVNSAAGGGMEAVPPAMAA